MSETVDSTGAGDMPGSDSAPLSIQLADALESVPAGPERAQIATMLRGCRVAFIGENEAREAREALAEDTDRVVRALDKLQSRYLPSNGEAVWFEVAGHARFGGEPQASGHDIDTVGCMLASDPHRPGKLVVFTGWRRGDGQLHHSYAITHIDLPSLAAAARRSRLFWWKPAIPISRHIVPTVPPSMFDELAIWQNLAHASEETWSAALNETSMACLTMTIFLLTVLLRRSATKRRDSVRSGPAVRWGRLGWFE